MLKFTDLLPYCLSVPWQPDIFLKHTFNCTCLCVLFLSLKMSSGKPPTPLTKLTRLTAFCLCLSLVSCPPPALCPATRVIHHTLLCLQGPAHQGPLANFYPPLKTQFKELSLPIVLRLLQAEQNIPCFALPWGFVHPSVDSFPEVLPSLSGCKWVSGCPSPHVCVRAWGVLSGPSHLWQ